MEEFEVDQRYCCKVRMRGWWDCVITQTGQFSFRMDLLYTIHRLTEATDVDGDRLIDTMSTHATLLLLMSSPSGCREILATCDPTSSESDENDPSRPFDRLMDQV